MTLYISFVLCFYIHLVPFSSYRAVLVIFRLRRGHLSLMHSFLVMSMNITINHIFPKNTFLGYISVADIMGLTLNGLT